MSKLKKTTKILIAFIFVMAIAVSLFNTSPEDLTSTDRMYID